MINDFSSAKAVAKEAVDRVVRVRSFSTTIVNPSSLQFKRQVNDFTANECTALTSDMQAIDSQLAQNNLL